MKNRLSEIDLGYVSAGALALAAASALALAVYGAPAEAATIIYSSAAPTSNGSQLPSGQQTLAAGITQVELDDGTQVSIIGPASYSVDANGQLNLAQGSFTAVASQGGTPMPILTGGGSVALTGGSSVNGTVSADGSFVGYALSGNVAVSGNGSNRNFSSGTAFQAGGQSAPGLIATAGVQPNNSTSSVLQLMLIAQQQASQYQANAGITSPTTSGFSGVALQTSPAIQQFLIQLANTYPGGGGGNPGGGGGNPGGGGGGVVIPIGSLADLFARIAAGETIPPGDPTVQALLDQLTVLPPGVDVDLIRSSLELAGYTLPPVLVVGGPGGGGGGGTPGAPVQIGIGNGVLPDAARTDMTASYAIVSDDGLYQDVTVLFDSNGDFSGYRLKSGFVSTLTGPDFFGNDRYVAEYGGDAGVMGIARIAGGTGALGLVRGGNGGDHHVWGVPMTNAPASGTLNYDLIAATSPTIRDSSLSPGTFTGDLAVSFNPGGIKWGIDANVAIGGDSFDIVSPGGTGAPGLAVLSEGRFSDRTIDIADSGVACRTGNCRVDFNGFLAGDGASHAGFTYTIRDDSSTVIKWIDGAAIFKAP